MPGLIEAASAMLCASERRLETVSANVANIATVGYKRQISFADLIVRRQGGGDLAEIRRRPDMASGKLADTGNPLDIAIGGSGFFQLRRGDAILYSRAGQFELADDGRVITAQGLALQQAGGGDLILARAGVEISGDGEVFDGERLVGRIAVFGVPAGGTAEMVDGSTFRIPGAEEIAEPGLRQGMIEASNVSVGDEMVTMMAAMRQAESGARLVQTYDDLMGRAISAFGQAER